MRIVTLRRIRPARPNHPTLTSPVQPAPRRRALLALTLLLAPLSGLLAACDTGTSGGTGNLTPLTVGLTFVPNIQFAPFYVADALGYYRDAGLNVTFHHHNASEDEFGALVAGQEDAIFASGDESLQARARGPELVYVATVYTKYPVTLIVPASSSIHSAADLRGHSVGIPGKYGGTYIGLLALLKSAGLKESDVNIQAIGFNQVQTLLSHQVDAVMGYLNNEPIQLQKQGFAVRTIDVASVQPLISNGLIAMQSKLQAHPEQIKPLVAATLRGLDYTLSHPQDAVNLSKSYVPNLSDSAQAAADALAVLNATVPLMQQNGPKPGYNDPAAWQSMASFLQSQGQLAAAVDVSQAYSNAYLP
jgi:NitT/TauT family transport system substrate-binding protein